MKSPTFRKPSLADFLILEHIGVRIVNLNTGTLHELTMESIVALIFVMSTPMKKLRALATHTEAGAERLRREIADFSAGISMEEIGPIAANAVAHLNKSIVEAPKS